jgi:hypothetical protein
MPYLPHSSATPCISIAMPDFDGGYAEPPTVHANDAIEPMPTMLLLRRAIIVRPTRCVITKAPVRLTSSTVRQSAMSISSSSPARTMPALLTSASGAPSRCTTSASQPSTASTSVMSRTLVRSRDSSSSLLTSSRPAASTSTAATRYPAESAKSTMARPMPRLAPVTTMSGAGLACGLVTRDPRVAGAIQQRRSMILVIVDFGTAGNLAGARRIARDDRDRGRDERPLRPSGPVHRPP